MHSARIRVDGLDQSRGGYPVFVHQWGNGDEPDPSPTGGLLLAASLPPPGAPNHTLDQWMQGQLWTRQLRIKNAEQIGDILGKLLVEVVPEATRSLLVCPRCAGEGGQPHSRVYLDVKGDLSRLPWELTRIDDEFVFGRRGHIFLREKQLGSPDAHVPPRMHPLKVLIVVGETDKEDRIRAESEIDAVYRAVNKRAALWRVKVMRVPAWSDLTRELDHFPPDIVHLIGHSAPYDDETAMVVRSDEHQGRYPLGADQLNRLFPALGSSHGPRLFILNTCNSMDMVARMDLSGRRACTVVAMQTRIEGSAATEFAQTFYAQLVDGSDVDVAAHVARHELKRRVVVDDHAWAVPVFIVSSRDHVLLPGYSAMLADSREHVNRVNVLWRTSLLDRVDEYRKLLDDHPLTGVTGIPGAGKSHLVCSYLLSCHQTGQLAVYVDFAANQARRAPRDAIAQLADEAFRQLAPELPNTDFGELIRHGRQGAELAETAALTVPEHFETVLHCLDLIADKMERDMVIALDSFDQIVDENQEDFAVQIRNVAVSASRSGSRVRVIVSCRPTGGDSAKSLADRWRDPGVPIIKVDGYPLQDLWSLYREACARYGYEWDADLGAFLLKKSQVTGAPWLHENFLAWLTAFQNSAGG
ncbi:hypothetical protein ABH920_007881 [Catenulispora sp. EB89]|uniref:CHAT domain-containing protein n=1 Tax=Catenulispora sp. EB89 TaxID=3156257 RepID=UPI00351704A7